MMAEISRSQEYMSFRSTIPQRKLTLHIPVIWIRITMHVYLIYSAYWVPRVKWKGKMGGCLFRMKEYQIYIALILYQPNHRVIPTMLASLIDDNSHRKLCPSHVRPNMMQFYYNNSVIMPCVKSTCWNWLTLRTADTLLFLLIERMSNGEREWMTDRQRSDRKKLWESVKEKCRHKVFPNSKQ